MRQRQCLFFPSFFLSVIVCKCVVCHFICISSISLKVFAFSHSRIQTQAAKMCRKFLIGSDAIVICKVLHCLWSLDTKELFISWFPFPLLPLSISQASRRGYGASLCECVCVCVCVCTVV